MTEQKHEVSVETVRDRYPHKPVCTCGQRFRGYAARHAAEQIAEAHRQGRL